MTSEKHLGASQEERTLGFWKVNDDVDFEVPNNTMLEEVVKYVEKYEGMPTVAVDFCTGPFARALAVDYIHNMNVGELVGTQSEKDTKEIIENILDRENDGTTTYDTKKTETYNNFFALQRLHEEMKEKNKAGYLDEDMICTIHGILLKGLNEGCGKIRNSYAYTQWKNGPYFYPDPIKAKNRFFAIVSQHNRHMDSIKGMSTDKKVPHLFRCAAWLLFHFVDTHPFADGNGRMCLLLSNYVVSLVTPFPVALYHVKNKECVSRDDYIEAIVECRKDEDKQPCRLCAMLVEGAWRGWKSFFSNYERLYYQEPMVGPIPIQKSNDNLQECVVPFLPTDVDPAMAVFAVQKILDQTDTTGIKPHQYISQEAVCGTTRIAIYVFPPKVVAE